MPKNSPIPVSNADPALLKFALIVGGAAGNLTVAGIKAGDKLKFVGGSTVASPTFTPTGDLTAQFTITADNTINNTGGSATTGALLLIVWVTRSTQIGFSGT